MIMAESESGTTDFFKKNPSDRYAIAVDLDGTLAEYHGWKGIDHIGNPVPAMVSKVRKAHAEGKEIHIFTARLSDESDHKVFEIAGYISEWLYSNGIPFESITSIKHKFFKEFWDDRAKGVFPNTGLFHLEGAPPVENGERKKIAILASSSNNFSNSGMISVDVAAYELFRNAFPDAEITFYVSHLSPESKYPYNSYVPYNAYEVIDHGSIGKIHESDLIVYWSDFFHTRHFLEQYMEKYVFESDSHEKRNLFFKAFFLENLPESELGKVVCFGNSFTFFSEYDYSKKDRYSDAVKRLYQNVKISMPRDIESFDNMKIAHSKRLGCDPAFLNMKTEPSRNKTGVIGIFLGRRTKIKMADLIAIKDYAKIEGKKVEWIHWMANVESLFVRAVRNPKQALNLLLHYIAGKSLTSGGVGYKARLDRYDLVITDTYHLGINAMVKNTPIFYVSDDSVIYGKESLDLHDKKKHILLKMMGLNSIGAPTVLKLMAAAKTKFSNTEYSKSIYGVKHTLLRNCKEVVDGE